MIIYYYLCIHILSFRTAEQKMKIAKLFAFSYICTILTACNLNNSHKPLMGGIAADATNSNIESYNTANDVSSLQSPTHEKTAGTNSTELELPAPLKNTHEQILQRTGYTVSYNSNTLLPNWVAWHLTANHTKGNVKRPQRAFHEDEDVKQPRATDNDYYNSGYDRGHMCPAADNKWSEKAMIESFLFTNMCPQNHNLNVGDWNELENACRKWAQRYGDIYIVSGPVIYKKTRHKTIGKNKVVVPDAFFKVILCMKGSPKAIAFIYKNEAGNKPKSDYVNTVDEVERITGIDFFPALPDHIERKVEAKYSLSDWGL